MVEKRNPENVRNLHFGGLKWAGDGDRQEEPNKIPFVVTVYANLAGALINSEEVVYAFAYLYSTP